MGLSKKVAGAITFWTHPNSRRRDILPATMTWGGGMAVIGVVFLILVCTSTFPGHGLATPGSPAFSIYVVKYLLYILSGGCACVGVMTARGALTSGRPTTAAKALLGAGAVFVVASAAMTIATLVRSASQSHAHTVPAYVYFIEILIILIRLLFASILALSIWTLVEADRDSAIADMALTGCGGPISQLPVSSKVAFDGYASQPAPSCYMAPPPAAAAAAGPYHTQLQPGMMTPAAGVPTAVLYQMPKQAGASVYPPQPLQQPQQPSAVVWGAPAVPVAAGPADPVSSYLAYKQQRREDRRQQRGLARFL